jgi:hypothetical protein
MLGRQTGANNAVLRDMAESLGQVGQKEEEAAQKAKTFNESLAQMGQSILSVTVVAGGLTGALVGLVGMLDPGRARIFHQEMRDLGASVGTILVPVLDVARVIMGWLNETFTSLSPTVKALTAGVVAFGLAWKLAWDSFLGPLGPVLTILAGIAAFLMAGQGESEAMGGALASIGGILSAIGDTLGVVLDMVGSIISVILEGGVMDFLKGTLAIIEVIIKTITLGIITIMVLLERLFGAMVGKQFEKSLSEELEGWKDRLFLGGGGGKGKTTAAPTQATVQGVEAMSMQLQQAGLLGGAGGPTKSEKHLENIDAATAAIRKLAEAWQDIKSGGKSILWSLLGPLGTLFGGKNRD